MKNKLFFAGVSFFSLVFATSCNPDPDVTQPPAQTSITTFDQAVDAINGTWYLDYREEILFSCSNTTGQVQSHVISDINYTDFQFEFTNTPANSMFGSGLSQYNTSDVFKMYGSGGAYSCPFFFYKIGASGNTFNPFLGAGSNADDLYLYCESQFQFDGENYLSGGRISFLDANNFTVEVSTGTYGKVVLHFTKNATNYSGNSQIQSIKGNYTTNYKDLYISGNLSQSVAMTTWGISISDTLTSPIGSVNLSTGSSDFPAYRNHWYIAHGLDSDWDGINGNNVCNYYPIGSDNSGNWIGREGELIMLSDGYITLSKDYSNGKPEVLKIISNSPLELVLRAYQGCNNYTDYHLTKVN